MLRPLLSCPDEYINAIRPARLAACRPVGSPMEGLRALDCREAFGQGLVYRYSYIEYFRDPRHLLPVLRREEGNQGHQARPTRHCQEDRARSGRSSEITTYPPGWRIQGGMAEWLKAPVLKTGDHESGP